MINQREAGKKNSQIFMKFNNTTPLIILGKTSLSNYDAIVLQRQYRYTK
jgi:hypothetical protein